MRFTLKKTVSNHFLINLTEICKRHLLHFLYIFQVGVNKRVISCGGKITISRHVPNKLYTFLSAVASETNFLNGSTQYSNVATQDENVLHTNNHKLKKFKTHIP